MATGGEETTSDEIVNIKCCCCFENNRTREADKFCVECKDYYCSQCIDTHQTFPATKGHKLLDKHDFTSLGPDGSLPCFPTQRCHDHQSEVINLYCQQHDEVACASCIALNHRACANIHSIPEEIDNLYNRTQLIRFKQKISMTKETMEQIKKAKERKVKKLKEAFDQEFQSIKAFRKELQTLLDKMEQEAIKELTQESDRIESSLTEEIQHANNLIDAINELSEQLKKSEGNQAQEFVSIKTADSVFSKTEIVENKQQKHSEETLSFDADQNIKAFLQPIRALGKVTIKTDKVTCNKDHILYIKDSLYKVKRQTEIYIELDNDTTQCSIHGSCLTEDGVLLLTDYTNKRLKRVEMSTKTVKDYLDFPVEPCTVCMISKTEAAVTLTNKTVQFVNLFPMLHAVRTLKMKHICYGLVHKDSKLYITDWWKTIYIYSMTGQELKRISTNASGKYIFQRIRHITLSADGDRLLVADLNKGLVILDIHGNHLTTLTDPALSDTRGVCTDGRNVFLCGLESNNINQVGPDYRILGQLENVSLKRPLSLCFDHRKIALIASLFNNNKIAVLELE